MQNNDLSINLFIYFQKKSHLQYIFFAVQNLKAATGLGFGLGMGFFNGQSRPYKER